MSVHHWCEAARPSLPVLLWAPVAGVLLLGALAGRAQQEAPARIPPAAQSQAKTVERAAPEGTGKPVSNPNSGETPRKKQITDQGTQLLSMALALKAEVDKTTKDTLSLNVIRKADEIEKLAHTVKEKMKSSGAS